MNKTIPLTLGILTLSTFAHANQARYTYDANCYVVETNTAKYTVHPFGPVTGQSNYSTDIKKGCQDAYHNLVANCNRLTQMNGFTGGSVYKDIHVLDKQSASTSSSSQTDQLKKRGLFAINERTHFHSASKEQSESSDTKVQYIQVDKKTDCEIDTAIPASNVPSTQNPALGG